MRGDVVVVRAFGGKALRRRVWDVGESVVYVTNDEQFENLLRGKRAVAPIGFPREDVFRLTATDPLHEPIDWTSMVLWGS